MIVSKYQSHPGLQCKLWKCLLRWQRVIQIFFRSISNSRRIYGHCSGSPSQTVRQTLALQQTLALRQTLALWQTLALQKSQLKATQDIPEAASQRAKCREWDKVQRAEIIPTFTRLQGSTVPRPFHTSQSLLVHARSQYKLSKCMEEMN